MVYIIDHFIILGYIKGPRRYVDTYVSYMYITDPLKHPGIKGSVTPLTHVSHLHRVETLPMVVGKVTLIFL